MFSIEIIQFVYFLNFNYKSFNVIKLNFSMNYVVSKTKNSRLIAFAKSNNSRPGIISSSLNSRHRIIHSCRIFAFVLKQAFLFSFFFKYIVRGFADRIVHSFLVPGMFFFIVGRSFVRVSEKSKAPSGVETWCGTPWTSGKSIWSESVRGTREIVQLRAN